MTGDGIGLREVGTEMPAAAFSARQSASCDEARRDQGIGLAMALDHVVDQASQLRQPGPRSLDAAMPAHRLAQTGQGERW